MGARPKPSLHHAGIHEKKRKAVTRLEAVSNKYEFRLMRLFNGRKTGARRVWRTAEKELKNKTEIPTKLLLPLTN